MFCIILHFNLFFSNFSNEKNFQIFYYLYDGLQNENKLKEYYLNSNKRQQRYLDFGNRPTTQIKVILDNNL